MNVKEFYIPYVKNLLCLLLVIGLFLNAEAQVAKTFFLPLPEEQLQQNFNSFSSAGNQMEMVVSITITDKNTIIYYDHWEDGYEVDIFNPVQPTTLIWGDGIPSNGMPPNYTVDLLNPGCVVSLRNIVPVPRNPSNIYFDARDKLLTEEYLVVAKANWATEPGSVLSGAVEVYDTLIYGNRFIVPIGEDTPGDKEMFENTSLYVMAAEDNTLVQIDANADGTFEISTILNQGENYYIGSGVLEGAEVMADKGVQAHLITGDIGALYETRWFGLYGSALWDDAFYTPVGTTSLNNIVEVYFYNPNSSAINVDAIFFASSTTITVQANGSAKYQMPYNSGAEFRSQGGEHFFVVSTIDSDTQNEGNTAFEWGFNLLPEAYLSSSSSVGWGPGTADEPPLANGSPIWVMATETTLIYIDYDGDPNTGPNTDPNEKQYNISYDLRPYESYRIYDPDHDATGMLIYNLQGNRMAMVWGEDPAVALPGNPYLDMGITVQPIRRVDLEKSAVLLIDQNGDGLIGYNDILEYRIRVNNRSFELRENFNLRDTLPPEGEYVAVTTTYNGKPISDNLPPMTIYPADETGATLDSIFPNATNDFIYRIRVRDPVAEGLPFFSEMTNKACLRTPDDELICTEHTVSVVSPSLTNCLLNFTDGGGNIVVNYLEGMSICVLINDGDQNMNILSVDTIEVRIFNLDNSDFEDIKLPETGVNTGLFEACVQGSPASGQLGNDGVLFASANETIQAEYTDPFFGEICIGNVAIVPPLETKSLYLTDPSQSMDRVSPADVMPADNTTATSTVLGEIETDFSSSPSLPMPDNDPAGVNDIITILGGGTIADLNVVVDITHTYVGDIIVSLTHVETGTQIFLIDQPGEPATTFGCISDDISATLDDGGASLAEDECSIVSPAISGIFIPNGNLGDFIGENMVGTWLLNVADVQGDDIGTFNSWSLDFTITGSGGPVSTIAFTQTPAMCSNLEIPSGGGVGGVVYVNEVLGIIPANPDITAVLKHGTTTFATMTNPIYNSLDGTINWITAIASGATLPAGQAVELEIIVNETGYLFEILYDSDTAPSKVDLETTTVISVDAFEIYNAPYAGGNVIAGATNGDVVYVRVTVSDPFGTYDITGLDLEITDPSSNTAFLNLGAAEEVNSSGCTKTYEYVWMTPNIQGQFDLKAIVHEGFENTIVDSATTSIIIQYDDLGTSCGLQFQDNAGMPQTNYAPTASQICIQVVDFDQNTTMGIDILDVNLLSDVGDNENLTLLETGASTGTFIACINFSAITIGTSGDNELYGPQGSILTATYIDTEDPSDICVLTASVNSLSPTISIAKTLLLPDDGIALVGDSTVFQIQAINPGQTTISSFTLFDTYDDGCLDFRSASETPASTTSNSMTWTEAELGALAAGASVVFTVTFDAVAACANTQNIISVNGLDEFGAPISDGPVIAEVTITDPSIAVTKNLIAPAAGPYYPNDTLTYQIDILNDGSTDIAVLPVSDFYNTSCLEFLDAVVPQNGIGGGTLLWNDIGPLPIGNTVSLTTRFKVKCGCSEVSNIVNIAFAEDINGDGVPPVSDTISTLITYGLPIALNDAGTTLLNTPQTYPVLQNDGHSANDSIQIVGAGTDALNGMTYQGGTVTINENGTPTNPVDDFINYTPLGGYIGLDTFLYQIEDPCGTLDTAMVIFTISSAVEDCSNGMDDDLDGLTDCDDPDCGLTASIAGDCTNMAVLNPQIDWTYQWFFNGAPIAGATAPSYIPSSSQGDYHAIVTNDNGCTFMTNVITVACCDPTRPSITGN